MNELILFLIVSITLNLTLFFIAYWKQSDKLTDASYALSFIALIAASALMAEASLYVLVGALLVCAWAVRIGGFLLYRVIKIGKDSRFDDFRSSFFGFMRFWLLQAITAWFMLIPLFFAFQSSSINGIPLVSVIGVIVLVVGLITEAIADGQKWKFSQLKSNKNKWVNSGIWRYSRHPNYFGEIVVWIGVYLYALPLLSVTEAIIALVSPLLIAGLLLFVTGVPLLEKSADKRWGRLEAYKEYKRSTSVLIPLPPKR